MTMLTSGVPDPSWAIAPGLTDVGGGVWVNGKLVDPS